MDRRNFLKNFIDANGYINLTISSINQINLSAGQNKQYSKVYDILRSSYIGNTSYGLGLFAAEYIKEGEYITEYSGELKTKVKYIIEER